VGASLQARFRRGLIRFEVFEPEFELLDVGAHLLRPLAEVHPFELEDQRTQVLDLSACGLQLLQNGA
jgi:hypothetical protein